ncbi:MAG TPA: hypothetical protein VHA78_02910 [Candidatus Peribacteraceae bacterium]|nr:hypothetical protein [Candidatus Peribacteraceae bacterium]
MKRTIPYGAVAALMLLLPVAASAHEHHVYQIGDKTYNLTVGSLNEPVYTGDKSGVEFIAEQLPKGASLTSGSDDGPQGTPVTGLETSMKVEVSAGGKTQTFDFVPEDGNDGAYEAVFYPTVATTYAYRLTGTINNVPVDVTYTCNPAGNVEVPEDTAKKTISANVTQLDTGGAFPCPVDNSSVMFPESAPSAIDLQNRISALEQSSSQSVIWGVAGMILGVIGVVIAVVALLKRRA